MILDILNAFVDQMGVIVCVCIHWLWLTLVF